ncbi:hypothetical protein GCM10010412_041520 [Nonomuraea recticatena]|uniref:Helix-turn-helix domain-containing protein n=1 Tax=Nonomuraea recticatena TaxID=46178 RepID=A0ABN3S0X2_9ACTN
MLNSAPETDRWLTVKEIHEYTGLEEQWIRRHSARYAFPLVRAGRYLRAKRSEIDQWMKSNPVTR